MVRAAGPSLGAPGEPGVSAMGAEMGRALFSSQCNCPADSLLV